MNNKKKLENEISFFRVIVADQNLITSNYFRVERFLILYHRVFENYINQICSEILTQEEQVAVNFQEFKNVFKYRSVHNFDLFNSPHYLIESPARGLLLLVWEVLDKTKSIQETSSLGFLKTKRLDLCALNQQIFNLSEGLSSNNISEIEAQLDIIIKEYNFYLLKGIELMYLRRELVVILVNLKKYPRAQFLFFTYVLSFDSQIFKDFTSLNSSWVKIYTLSQRILSLKVFEEIKNNSKVFISKLNKFLGNFD
jgi:hypothetical protein